MLDELPVSSLSPSPAADAAGGVSSGGADAPSGAQGPAHRGPSGDGAADAAPAQTGPEAQYVPRAEFDKVVAQRQAAKEKARQLAAVARDLAGRLAGPLAAPAAASAADADASAADDAEFLDLEAIHGRLREPLQRRLAALQAENAAARRRLMELLRDQAVRTAAARAGAINPDQVVVLLRDRVAAADAGAGPDGPASAAGASAGGDSPAGVRQLVEQFLRQDENANLVGCSVAAGSGARQAGGPGVHVDNLPRTRAEFLALPSEQRAAAALRMTRQQRDELLGRNAQRAEGYL